jgi:cytosine/uracil/thiamine/allantoin permease
MCLRATYSKFWTGKHLPGSFSTQNGLKKNKCIIFLVFQLLYIICHKGIQANQGRLKLNEIHQVHIKAIMFFYWVQTNAQALAVDTEQVCLNVNTKNTEYMIVSFEQKVQ